MIDALRFCEEICAVEKLFTDSGRDIEKQARQSPEIRLKIHRNQAEKLKTRFIFSISA